MNNAATTILIRNIPMVAIIAIVAPNGKDKIRIKNETRGRLIGNDFTKNLYVRLFFVKNSKADMIKVGVPNIKNTLNQVAGCINIIFSC